MPDEKWLALVREEPVDPGRPIIDTHHHLWRRPDGDDYVVEDLQADCRSGHNVVKTVFVECRAEYRSAGPEHLRPVGETEFVVRQAALGTATGGPEISAIVGHADLRLDPGRLGEVLDAHEDAGSGLFRGIRHAGVAEEPEPESTTPPPASLYEDPPFRRGVRALGERGLTYDTFHYHYQNPDFAVLAAAVPETVLVLDHLGLPVGTGRYEGRREEVFEVWKRGMAAIAEHENVVVKLGGFALPKNGFGFHTRAEPPTSDELVALQGRYYLHAIECFGPGRCMFESNFPVDKVSVSYHVLFNAMKKMVAAFSPDEQHAMFCGTAERVYRL